MQASKRSRNPASTTLPHGSSKGAGQSPALTLLGRGGTRSAATWLSFSQGFLASMVRTRSSIRGRPFFGGRLMLRPFLLRASPRVRQGWGLTLLRGLIYLGVPV